MRHPFIRTVLLLSAYPVLLFTQQDPASLAYQAWDTQHQTSDYKARAQSLFEVSAAWVAQWSESLLAWKKRREALIGTGSHSPELWKQADSPIIRLSPPYTFASIAAADWIAANVNWKEAEELVASEIAWRETRPPSAKPAHPSLTDLIDEAESATRLFGPRCTLAAAQIKLKKFEQAYAVIGQIRAWLSGDFKRAYDPDPLETFPDYESKLCILSAQLAQAEGQPADALAF